MSINILIYIAIIPVVLLLMYIYKKDKHKEPTKILVKTFLFGVLIVIPAVIIEIVLGRYFPSDRYKNLFELFINVFIAIALVEESLKWIIIKLSIYKNSDFDETFDGIVYAVFASLGFACIENILYVLLNGFVTGLMRAVTAVPLHACTGIIMGYYVGKAKLYSKNNKTKENTYIIFSLLLPATVHAIYDYLIMTEKAELVIIWFITTIITYIICFFLIKNSTNNNTATDESKIIVSEDKTNTIIENNHNQNTTEAKGIYCRKCGFKIEGSNYCPNCGNKNE